MEKNNKTKNKIVDILIGFFGSMIVFSAFGFLMIMFFFNQITKLSIVLQNALTYGFFIAVLLLIILFFKIHRKYISIGILVFVLLYMLYMQII